jgi:hypothetical protein
LDNSVADPNFYPCLFLADFEKILLHTLAGMRPSSDPSGIGNIDSLVSEGVGLPENIG